MFAAIEWGKLLEVIWVSAVLGTAGTALFAVTIYGTSRAQESRRTGQGASALFGAMGLVSLAAFGALVVFAILTILNKS
jgi:hypothetical protein